MAVLMRVAAGAFIALTLGLFILPTKEYEHPETLLVRTPDGITRTVLHANTPYLRVLGLSGRETLAPYDGMLLSFSTPGRHGIWMPDMYFALDILWLSDEGTIVHLEQNITPDTYPTVFKPPLPVMSVLELPAGTASSSWMGGHVTEI